jgi:hypothetical protein
VAVAGKGEREKRKEKREKRKEKREKGKGERGLRVAACALFSFLFS